MAEKMIKHLLFTYGKEVPNPLYTEGGNEPETVLQEGLARLGEVVDVTRPYDLHRGEELDAFFSDKDRKAIEEGKYRGPDAPTVVAARLARAQAEVAVEPAEGEGTTDTSDMSSEEIAAFITENKLNVDQTVDLADPNDVDSINKVLDAENLASDNDPRAGVVKALEARLAAASQ
jgi:hypothetical protein